MTRNNRVDQCRHILYELAPILSPLHLTQRRIALELQRLSDSDRATSHSTSATTSFNHVKTMSTNAADSPQAQIQAQIQAQGKPRRPHHKSRTGCLQCKQRKVKVSMPRLHCIASLRIPFSGIIFQFHMGEMSWS